MAGMKATIQSVPLYIWALFILSSFLWVLMPQIDLHVTRLLYTEGAGFTLRYSWWEQGLYRSVEVLLIGVNVGALSLWLYNRFMRRSILAFTGKKLLYVLLVLALGSGLIVNALLKEHWGRARPAQTLDFGGKATFTPAFVLSDQGGNSFACGHASGAFAFIAYAMLAQRRRSLWMALALSYGFAVGFARMAAGGHFLSDVVVSFFVLYITARMLYYGMFERGL